MAAFRFDFHGLGGSDGTTSFCPHAANLCDLECVVDYLTGPSLRLSIEVLYGYSAGGNVVLKYLSKHCCCADDGDGDDTADADAAAGRSGVSAASRVPYVVLSSPRFDMSRIKETIAPDSLRQLYSSGSGSGGSFEYTFTKRGKPVTLTVPRADVDTFAAMTVKADCRAVNFAQVLHTHGIDDTVCPQMFALN